MSVRAKVRLRKQAQAAELLARGELTQAQVAEAVGTTTRSIERWVADPVFAAQVEAAREAFRQAIRAEGIANKQNRIDAYNRRWELMHSVLSERGRWSEVAGAGDPSNLEPEEWIAPGAETGLLVRTVRYTPTGKVVEWAADTALLKELREHEKQAATELGQWTEKKEVTGKDGAPLDVVIRTVVVERPAPAIE